MTNQEKNIRIAQLLCYDFYEACDHLKIVADSHYTFNPCEDWSQLMPLCIEHDISMVKYTGIDNYIIQNLSSAKTYCHSNPQTALVDCLIAVLEAKAKG
jgi:hypothetical protein